MQSDSFIYTRPAHSAPHAGARTPEDDTYGEGALSRASSLEKVCTAGLSLSGGAMLSPFSSSEMVLSGSAVPSVGVKPSRSISAKTSLSAGRGGAGRDPMDVDARCAVLVALSDGSVVNHDVGGLDHAFFFELERNVDRYVWMFEAGSSAGKALADELGIILDRLFRQGHWRVGLGLAIEKRLGCYQRWVGLEEAMKKSVAEQMGRTWMRWLRRVERVMAKGEMEVSRSAWQERKAIRLVVAKATPNDRGQRPEDVGYDEVVSLVDAVALAVKRFGRKEGDQVLWVMQSYGGRRSRFFVSRLDAPLF